MAISEYKRYLNDIWNTYTVYVPKDLSYSTIIIKSLRSAEEYLNFIKSFFSTSSNYGNGEANNIKTLYDKISKLSYTKNIPIKIIFSPSSFSTYNDYITGMNQFVHDIINAVNSGDTDKIDLFSKQIETAKENDKNFSFNIIEQTSREVEISDSIDILNQLVDFKENIKSLINILDSYEELNIHTESELIFDAIELLTSSIDTYCFWVLNRFLDSYDLICKEVERLTTLHKPDFEDKPFALF